MDPEIFNNQAFFQASTSLTIREGITILLIALLYGLYLRFLYFKFAITFSSKVSFGNTLLIVIVSVASLVAVVKASLALSLGLVGALSVIRFRTAVKEPLNLSFILLAISLAIAIGASQYLFTFLIAVVGNICIYLSYRSSKSNKQNNNSDNIDTIYLTMPANISINDVEKIIMANTSYYSFISIDQDDSMPISIVLNVKLKDNQSLNNLKNSIFTNFPKSSFRFFNTPEI